LTKPGIIYGNLVTAFAGFLLACKWRVDISLLLATLGGISLVIASACAFNNYIDRDIDKKMSRTKKRALAAGDISGQAVLVFASVLGLIGFLILATFTNRLVVAVNLFAIFSYVVLYGIAKRRTVHGTLVGSIPGAIPPVAAYLAITNHFDTATAILFFILVTWQMPHFYAIALYRYNDYKAAGLPVIAIKRGKDATKQQIMAYVFTFSIVCTLLSGYGYTGLIYLLGVVLVGGWWFWQGAINYRRLDYKSWGKKMFASSLVVNLSISLLIAFGAVLP
jgi:protoheme IX farnesyltransferase